MKSMKIRGQRGSFTLCLREWDGYDKPDYTPICKLTDDEADCLSKSHFVMTLAYGIEDTDTCISEYISLQPMKNFDIIGTTGVVYTLPPNEELGRPLVVYPDPEWRSLSLIEAHVKKEQLNLLKFKDDPDSINQWSDNPAECNTGW